jgi:flagellar basal body-associated protein FliL
MSSPTPPAGEPAASRGRARLVLGACVLLLAGAGVVARQTLAKKARGAPERPVRRAVEAVIDPDPFVLNLPDAAGDRWFRLDLAIVVDDAALAARAADGLGAAKLRDRMLAVLARMRPATLTAPDAKESLRVELRAAAQALLSEPPFTLPAADAAGAIGGTEATGAPAPARVLDVYFTEFLLQ